MNVKHYLTCVDEFHKAFNYEQPTPEEPIYKKELLDFRIDLIKEEFNELNEAIEKNDRIEQLDACCDLQYVISGSALAMGCAPSFVQHVLTGTEFVKSGFYDNETFESFLKKIEKNHHFLIVYFSLFQIKLHEIIADLGFSEVFDAAFDKVHENNMDKFWTEEEMSMGSSHNRYVHVPEKGYIAYREDGKIIKPPHHKKVDLSSFV